MTTQKRKVSQIFLLFIMQAKLAGSFQCLKIFAAIASQGILKFSLGLVWFILDSFLLPTSGPIAAGLQSLTKLNQSPS